MKKRGFSPILVVIVLALIGAVGFYYFVVMKGNVPAPLTGYSSPTAAQTLVYYRYAAAVMGKNVVNTEGNPLVNFDPVVKFSPFESWKIYDNENDGYKIKYPPELNPSGNFFDGRRNAEFFGHRIAVVGPQPWNIFEDKDIKATPSNIKTLTINGMNVRYGEFIEYSGKIIDNYYFIYQFPNGSDFLTFIYDFIDDSNLCSKYLKPVSDKAPPGYPGNTICEDDFSPKTPSDYQEHYKAELDVFNQMAQTITVFAKNPNPLPIP